jgi:hypothetical protein
MGRGKPMAKDESELPQEAPEAEMSPQAVTPATPTVSTQGDNKPDIEASGRWWEKLYEHWVEVLAGGFLVSVSVGFLFLWLGEYREHEGTKGELKHEKESKEDLISENGQLKKGLIDLRQENAGLKKMHPFFKFFGPRTMLIRSFDLYLDPPKEPGQMLDWGDCPKDPIRALLSDTCIRFKLLGIQKRPNGVYVAQLVLQAARDRHRVISDLRLLPGCKMVFAASAYEVTFAVEAVEIGSAKVLIGISLGLAPEEKIKKVDYECPQE